MYKFNTRHGEDSSAVENKNSPVSYKLPEWLLINFYRLPCKGRKVFSNTCITGFINFMSLYKVRSDLFRNLDIGFSIKTI
jgi:hypothetical protein